MNTSTFKKTRTGYTFADGDHRGTVVKRSDGMWKAETNDGRTGFALTRGEAVRRSRITAAQRWIDMMNT